ncbi:MAG: SRPBCC family protein [Caulobacter sp.]|nr:SRPBCC family protein [Caulobacter sp.]
MTDVTTLEPYGVLIEPATLRIQRLLPGPVDRLWAYLTESELRRQWLAAGAMEMRKDSPFQLVWRNGELSDPPGRRPDGFGEEHSMEGRITDLDPPRKLVISWGGTGGVSFELEPRGDKVLLTLTHHRVLDKTTLLNVSAGWHAHLDVLAARLDGRKVTSFWDSWQRLKGEYAERLGG